VQEEERGALANAPETDRIGDFNDMSTFKQPIAYYFTITILVFVAGTTSSLKPPSKSLSGNDAVILNIILPRPRIAVSILAI
jgi:hypothetical protein